MSGVIINNGARLPVAFGNFRGVAGVVRLSSGIDVAFIGDFDVIAKVRTGSIDGAPVRVIKAAKRPVQVGGRDLITLTVEELPND